MPRRIGQIATALLLYAVLMASAQADPKAGYFGSQDRSEGGLVGILYDLKQTQQRKGSSVNPNSYVTVVGEFLAKGWDESVLNQYFRCGQPLYTTQIYIPLMGAGEAPKAFGVDKVVKPSCWVAHYKGQVSPPESGVYRLVGYADDLMAAAIDGKTCLFGSRFDISPKTWKASEPPGAQASNGKLTYGDWVTLKKDEPVDLDVLIGERPGGQFNAFLLYQKQGENYPQDHGNPVLPVFQLAPFDMPAYAPREGPLFSKTDKYWKGY